MARKLTEYEERLVELVHLLAAGTPEEYGLTLHEVKEFLNNKYPKKGKTPLELIKADDQLIRELKDFMLNS